MQPYHNEISENSCGGLIKQRQSWENMKDRQITALYPDKEIPNNQIKTAKYTYLTFIPLNLMFQFSKLANAYFLIIGMMQTVQAISITNGQPVIFGPLIIVISISMIKDFFEDYGRHRSDREENTKNVQQISDIGFGTTTWQELLVGDIVKISQNEIIPADMVILVSSDNKGKAYVETKSLDGETNLKEKLVSRELLKFAGLRNIQNPFEQLQQSLFSCSYEGPNPYLYKFNGSMTWLQSGNSIPISADNFMLRGSKLMNTLYVWGVVVYSGHDTKIMLNSVKARPKKSRLEETMNKFIILIFGLQCAMCFTAALYSNEWYAGHKSDVYYLEMPTYGQETNYADTLFMKWGSWILIFTNFVPISLLVSLEMVKFFQGMMMAEDEGTFSKSTGIKLTVQTSNLNEELGQVEYVFSDKTGTLTKNQMDFKKLTIAGRSYDQENLTDQEISKLPIVTNVDFRDIQLLNDLKNPTDPLRNYMLCLSLCHTIMTQVLNNEITYNASSPDELALVNFAKICGYRFMGIDDDNNMTIRIYKDPFEQNGQYQEMRYKLLNVLEFSSARKRQSVILKDPQNRIIMYTKGADSVIEKRLSNSNPQLKQKSWDHLNEYARVGLRTLALTQRVITPNAYNEWANEYQQASTSIQDREQKIEKVQEKIEVDLELLGGTAIEDKLQDDIGPTIKSLKQAGMKVWVLTGDKVETAINIGISCQLLDQDMQLNIIDGVTEDVVQASLNKANQMVTTSVKGDHGVVVTGDALIVIMSNQDMISSLMKVCDQCQATMACRVSPKQKQEVVAMVRKYKPTVTTLAIGDGANDVNMITAAHVGVGIRGVEGQQAARASDYAIGEFKVLRRLTLYHGRECYRRNSKLVTYNFYKNMLLVLPQFWYGFYNGLTAVSLYDPIMYQCYNLFYTSLPIIIFAIFDSEFSGDYLLQNPDLYQIGILNQMFNYEVFVTQVTSGAMQALIGGMVTYQLMEKVSMTQGGQMGDIFTSGSAVLAFSVYNSTWKVLLFSNSYSIAVALGISGSIAIYLSSFSLISHFQTSSDTFGTYTRTFDQLLFYLVWLAITGATTALDLGFTRWRQFSLYSFILAKPQTEEQMHQSDFVKQGGAPLQQSARVDQSARNNQNIQMSQFNQGQQQQNSSRPNQFMQQSNNQNLQQSRQGGQQGYSQFQNER